MSEANKEKAREVTEALNRGDMETFLQAHSPDVKMHVGGRNAGSGEYQGREGVAEAFQRVMGLLDGPPAFEVHDVLASDDHVVMLGTQKATRGGKTLESNAYITLHVKDGLFSEVWVTPVDPYADDEFLA
jgi:ketosteroid isomerase-like protein